MGWGTVEMCLSHSLSSYYCIDLLSFKNIFKCYIGVYDFFCKKKKIDIVELLVLTEIRKKVL